MFEPSDRETVMKIERELKQLYEEHFNINTDEPNYRIFTRDEQIKRYGDNLAFWWNLMINYREELRRGGMEDSYIKKDLRMIVIYSRLRIFHDNIKQQFENYGTFYKEILDRSKKQLVPETWSIQ